MIRPLPTPVALTRRTLLRDAGLASVAVGSAALLSACGSGESASQSGKSQKPSGPPVTVDKAQVPVGDGVVLEKKYVVTQPTEGTYKAFSKICPHQGCPVSFIKNAQIVCACHSSEFSITDGKPTSGPARQPLEEVPVKVEGNSLLLG